MLFYGNWLYCCDIVAVIACVHPKVEFSRSRHPSEWPVLSRSKDRNHFMPKILSTLWLTISQYTSECTNQYQFVLLKFYTLYHNKLTIKLLDLQNRNYECMTIWDTDLVGHVMLCQRYPATTYFQRNWCGCTNDDHPLQMPLLELQIRSKTEIRQ